MHKGICPACDASIEIEGVYLFKHVRCPECDALLEIIEENPLELKEIPEEEGEEED
ncbi:MAG: lysine biosynthesis protein LysW [Dehalococcoidia bacterium]|nr:lysine biosynthesis protein LysW [Dehalococcoidia bacterium]